MGSPLLIVVVVLSRFATAFLNSFNNQPESFALPTVAAAQIASLILICLFGRPDRSNRKTWLGFGLWTFSTLFLCAVVMKLAERQMNVISSFELMFVELALPLLLIAILSYFFGDRTQHRQTIQGD